MIRHLDAHGLTDIGHKRTNNEDQFLIADLSKSMRVHQTSLGLDDQTQLFGDSQGILLLVADGMGGRTGGKLASQMAVNSLAAYLLNTMHWLLYLDQQGEDDFLDDLKLALEHCRSDIKAITETTPERQGMGTTLTLAYVIWPRLYIVHAGDSRCYLLRNSQLQQITTDHTIAQQLVEKGSLHPKEAEASRLSKVLIKVIGGSGDKVNAEVHKAELSLGDTLLLCTDGLHRQVPDDQLLEMLDQNPSAIEACQMLVKAANDAGGRDNMTVVVARFCDNQQQEALIEEAYV